MYEPPTDEAQVQFLLRLQRLLSEGSFTATYKYALLLALADLAVEYGEDTGAPLVLPVSRIARRYIEYYWPQAAPYIPRIGQPDEVLRQNTLGQAAIVTAVTKARGKYATLAELERDGRAWRNLVSRVTRSICQEPLWRLQRVGDQVLDFLYENCPVGTRVKDIELRSGVTFCFRRFHVLLSQMVRADWLAYVLRVNGVALGAASDLSEFLFGSARGNLSGIRPALVGLQGGKCFYCLRELSGLGDVDHFIPWARYPVDLGHNFVVAHATCNIAKGSMLAAEEHLARWARRNLTSGAAVADACDQAGMVHDQAASRRIAAWAYEQTAAADGLLWLALRVQLAITGRWREALAGKDGSPNTR